MVKWLELCSAALYPLVTFLSALYNCEQSDSDLCSSLFFWERHADEVKTSPVLWRLCEMEAGGEVVMDGIDY